MFKSYDTRNFVSFTWYTDFLFFVSGNPASVQLESNATTQIYAKKFYNANFFQIFFALHLHFVKELAAYSISNFSDFKFNTAIYNKDLKYASVFKFFFAVHYGALVNLHCTASALCCIVLHCAALRCAACVAITTALRCIVQTQLQTCIACSTALQVVISVHIAKP